jgi:F420-dependent oxidoreductase-like protein
MIEVALMIEGQNGLNWDRWQKVAKFADDAGFVGLYRSDHFTNATPPDLDSLELWVSLTWLASNTSKLEFGPLVSPVSFRNPMMTARIASAVDDLSGGRLILGLGAGWQEREHDNYGFDLLEVPERFDRFEEGLEVVTQLLRSDQPVGFEGEYYQLQEAIMLPRPQRPGGPPILIGGNGRKRTLPLVVKYASEWNAVYLPAEKFRETNQHLDMLLKEDGRDPQEIKRSMMIGCEFGRDDQEAAEVVEKRSEGKYSAEQLASDYGFAVGTSSQVVDHLGTLAEMGVQRVMLQWLGLDDLDRLEAMAATVLPQVQG